MWVIDLPGRSGEAPQIGLKRDLTGLLRRRIGWIGSIRLEFSILQVQFLTITLFLLNFDVLFILRGRRGLDLKMLGVENLIVKNL